MENEYQGRSYIAPPTPLTLALMPFLAAAADDSAFAIAGFASRIEVIGTSVFVPTVGRFLVL